MSTDVSAGGEYQRGVTAGQIDERLAGHDEHLSKINGNIREMTVELHGLKIELTTELARMTMALQRLVDASEASAREALATAKALKEADHARWAPWQKGLALLAGLSVLAGLIASLVRL